MNIISVYKGDFNKNLKFFFLLIDKYNTNINLSPLSFNLFTCRQLLDEIILECKSNNLNSKINNDLFNKKIDDLLRKDYLVNSKQKNDLNYLKSKIYEKNSDLVYSICYEINKSFRSKTYFNQLVNYLIIFLKDEKNDNSDQIKNILDSIFIELINQGLTSKQVAEKIGNLFSFSKSSKTSDFQHPYTSFPTEFIKHLKEPNKINDYINNLSVYERINYIKNYYVTKKQTYYLVIPINGISLTNKNLKCNKDISLYNPEYLDPFYMSGFREDKFRIDYKNHVNACIKIKAFNHESAYVLGIKKLNHYVNLLKLISPLDNFNILEKQKILLDDTKKLVSIESSIYSNSYEEREFKRNISPVEDYEIFNDNNMIRLNNKISSLIYSDEDEKTNTEQIILNSIRKYSEALDYSNEQEAILKFWSSIESLFDNNLIIENKNNKFEILKEIISSYMTYSTRYVPLHELYRDLASALALNYKKERRNQYSILNLPVKLLKNINLYEINKKPVSLQPLITYNNDLKKYIDDYYFLKKINYIDKYFNDKSFSKKEIKNIKHNYETSIVIIYRLRNQIIHNALSNDITTKFYLPLLRKVTVSFLNDILDVYIENKEFTINDIILNIYTKSTLFIKSAENCTLLSLLY